MTKRPALSPLGTARERLLATMGQPPHYTTAVAERLREFNLGEEAAYLAWEVVRCAPGLSGDEERALFLLVLASIVNLHQGSTRLPVRGALGVALDALLLKLDGAWARPVIERLLDDRRLEPVLGRPGDYRPLLLEGDHLYHQRTLHFEDQLAAALARRLGSPELGVSLRQVQRALDEVAGDRLSAEQRYAVLTAVCAPLAVVSGGPGTGKTSIVVAILRVLARLGVPMSGVALAAPTGKAAHRMKESVLGGLALVRDPDAFDQDVAAVPEPRTLHRLLGYSPAADRFKYHEHNRLPDSVIIVDEGSMVDLYLMNQLVHAVRDDARLILLGDAEQLPSVEAGAVFRNLVPPGVGSGASPWRALLGPEHHAALPPPVASSDPRWRAAVRLTHSYRMDAGRAEGRQILQVAGQINRGEAAKLLGDEELLRRCARVEDLRFAGVDLLEGPGLLGAFCDRWLEARVLSLPGLSALARRPVAVRAGQLEGDEAARLDPLFDHHEGSRVLCVTRSETEGTGADAINAHLHAGLARALGLVVDDLCPGAVVMMQHNDYDRGLFNGDQGVVLPARGDDGVRPAVVFRRAAGRYAVFRLEALRSQLQLSFAMTVHKSQGSEFDHVALVLPGANMPLLSREVLYTAVTRSRASVTLVGRGDLLAQGIEQPIARFSGVDDKITAASAG